MDNAKFNLNKILSIVILIICFIILLLKDYFISLTPIVISFLCVIFMKFKTIQLVGTILQLISVILFIYYPNTNNTIENLIGYIFLTGLLLTLAGGAKKKKEEYVEEIEETEEVYLIENTEIKDDVEQWFQDCYMCWIIINNDKENWNKIAGRNKTQDAMNEHREVLARDWSIHNKEELLEMVYSLTEESIDTLRKKITIEDIKRLNLTNIESYLAWDMCRAVQILGMGYISDYITRDEMREYSIKVCKLIQKEFNSWDDLIRNYLIGCKRHFEELDMHQDRTSIYEMLRDKKIAYQVDWNLNLE